MQIVDEDWQIEHRHTDGIVRIPWSSDGSSLLISFCGTDDVDPDEGTEPNRDVAAVIKVGTVLWAHGVIQHQSDVDTDFLGYRQDAIPNRLFQGKITPLSLAFCMSFFVYQILLLIELTVVLTGIFFDDNLHRVVGHTKDANPIFGIMV